MSRLDILIFGATGFTGKCVVKEAVRMARRDKALSWGISGRSSSKLNQVLKEVGDETGEDLSSLMVLIADAGDEEALKAMTAQAKVVVNCCGPYRYSGEPVVRACIATNTSYVDITAEIQFMQYCQLKYSFEAEAAGVYIVNACGLDCIPTDLGVIFLKQQFKGVLNSVESFMTLDISNKYRKLGTPLVNYGTYESLVNMMANGAEREFLKQKLYPEPAPTLNPKMKLRRKLYKAFDNWFLPSDLADDDIVYRTQRYFHQTDNQRPVQFKSYVGIPTRFEAFFAYIIVFIGYWLISCGVTRKFLLNHPKLCTLGYISRKGVPAKIMDSIKFSCYLRGEGWDESVRDVDSTPPNKILIAKLSGVNPGYAFTAVASLNCALTILREKHNMPPKGGVLTPGIAFANTSLIQTLYENDYKFEILK